MIVMSKLNHINWSKIIATRIQKLAEGKASLYAIMEEGNGCGTLLLEGLPIEDIETSLLAIQDGFIQGERYVLIPESFDTLFQTLAQPDAGPTVRELKDTVSKLAERSSKSSLTARANNLRFVSTPTIPTNYQEALHRYNLEDLTRRVESMGKVVNEALGKQALPEAIPFTIATSYKKADNLASGVVGAEKLQMNVLNESDLGVERKIVDGDTFVNNSYDDSGIYTDSRQYMSVVQDDFREAMHAGKGDAVLKGKMVISDTTLIDKPVDS